MYLDYFVNTTSPMYNFDVDSEHEDHSEELLLFVGCIVNFIVSYLICMFQDSVPAGSYNDPFLSSVCVIMFDRVRHQTKPGVPRVIVEGAPSSGQHISRKNLCSQRIEFQKIYHRGIR